MTTTTVLRAQGCAYVVRTVLAQRRRVDAHLDVTAPNDLRQDSLRATYAEVAQSAVPGFRIEHAPADNVQARMFRRAESRTNVTTVDGGRQELGNMTVWTADRAEGWTCLYGRAYRAHHDRARAKNGAKGGRPATCKCLTCAKCKARARQAERRARLRQEKMDRNADLANARAAKGPGAAVAVSAASWDQDH